jgi:hypothetical protein
MRPCGATREPIKDAGWECTGRGLIIVMTLRFHGLPLPLPVALPARALEIHQPEEWWDTPVQPFTGGDHLHLCVPREPPPAEFRTNATVLIGDLVMRGWIGDLPMRDWKESGNRE